jgi:hypothetical protein
MRSKWKGKHDGPHLAKKLEAMYKKDQNKIRAWKAEQAKKAAMDPSKKPGFFKNTAMVALRNWMRLLKWCNSLTVKWKSRKMRKLIASGN